MVLVEEAAMRGDWHQGSWRCGTARCFAGWAVEAARARWAYGEEDDMDTYGLGLVEDELGGYSHVAAWAQAALGLTPFQAGELFNATNTLEDIRNLVDVILSANRVLVAA
jgi:hypothetical protein